jgi:small subunit ribosomal protein S6
VTRDYELGFILQPEVNEEQTRAVLDRVEQVVVNHSGQIVRVNQWGRRRLAYPIQHNRDGFYVFIDMILTPETVIELDRTLKVSEDVLRYMIKRRDPKAVQKEREARAAAAAAPATQPAEAQDEMVSPVREEVVGEETEAPVALSAEDMEDVPPAIEDEDEDIEDVPPAIEDEDIEDVPPAIDEEDSEAESV